MGEFECIYSGTGLEWVQELMVCPGGAPGECPSHRLAHGTVPSGHRESLGLVSTQSLLQAQGPQGNVPASGWPLERCHQVAVRALGWVSTLSLLHRHRCMNKASASCLSTALCGALYFGQMTS